MMKQKMLTESKSDMEVDEEMQCAKESKGFVVLSNLEINEAKNIESLERVLKTINDDCLNVDTVVLIGDFISKQNSKEMSIENQKMCFDSMIGLIKSNERLCREVRFIIVPGPNDPGTDDLLPQFELPEFFFESAGSSVKHMMFAQNPLRLSYYGKQVVICRYNYFKKMKKTPITLGGDESRNEDESEERTKITQEAQNVGLGVLKQGNLIPFPFIVQPVRLLL
jgi:DNA polymerase epsilon subunit 2